VQATWYRIRLSLAGAALRVAHKLAPPTARGRRPSRAFVLLSLLALVLLGTLVTLQVMRGLSDRAKQADAVTATRAEVVSGINDLDSSLHNYVFTGDEHYLVLWRRARLSLAVTTTRLERLAPGSALRLYEEIDAYVRYYAAPLIALWRRDPAAAQSEVALADGALWIGEIRTLAGGSVNPATHSAYLSS
jgi:CHASE3 domain sensor protein